MPENHETKPGWIKQGLLNFVLPKIKFASTSILATGIDTVVYLVLVSYFLEPIPANIIAYSCGMITNFVLQKNFIFQLNRGLKSAFLLSLVFSLGGMAIETFIISRLNLLSFFRERQYITKLTGKGIVFFYNFYTKRFAFEKK